MGARTHARNISHFEKPWWCKNDPKVHIFFLKSDILCLMCANHTLKKIFWVQILWSPLKIFFFKFWKKNHLFEYFCRRRRIMYSHNVSSVESKIFRSRSRTAIKIRYSWSACTNYMNFYLTPKIISKTPRAQFSEKKLP